MEFSPLELVPLLHEPRWIDRETRVSKGVFIVRLHPVRLGPNARQIRASEVLL